MDHLYRTSWNSLLTLRGEDALYQGEALPGIFLENPETYDYQNDVVVRLTDPTFTVHEDDLKAPDAMEGGKIYIRGLPFTIREQNTLGYGRIELRLISGKS